MQNPGDKNIQRLSENIWSGVWGCEVGGGGPERDNPGGGTRSSTRPWLSTDLSTNVEISQDRPALSARSFLAKTGVLLVLWLFTAVVPGNTGAPIPASLMGSNSYFFFF